MLKGEEGLEPYMTFSRAITPARARGVIALHRHAREGGKGSAQSLTILERRFHTEYGNVTKLEHSGPAGKPIESNQNLTIDYSQLSDAELRRLAESGAEATA